jgi:two-component system CheB/CheR fusion protein
MADKKSRKSGADKDPNADPLAENTASAEDAKRRGRPAVVGIGASAGGLEAVTALLKALPGDTGLAFVLVQHLDPSHPSALVEILAKVTPMQVSEAKEGSPVVANRLYVIPPNSDIAFADGVLRLSPRPGAQTPHMPIDRFLQTLADGLHSQALGVILSGTGSDGTSGLLAIKAEGGITFAQDDTARHDGMPRSAVAAGCVDHVLAPEEIAGELQRIAEHPAFSVSANEPPEASIAEPDDVYSQIIRVISGASGVDFQHYKRPTLVRRIERRMMVRRKETPEEYLRVLREDPAEAQAVFQEVLIPVTNFFRNAKMFEALTRQVLPKLLEDRAAGAPVRVWVAGCSTGEEAYSLAICLTEFLDDLPNKPVVKLFATDVNEVAIETARNGRYLDNIAADVSPGRLRRFFVKTELGYQINKTLRDQCVFARHDVTKNPPFSQLDVISCRNVLIYVDSIMQQRVLPIFHYALKPGGFLVLGGSESVGGFTDLFQVVNRDQKIFARLSTASRLVFTWSPSGEFAPPTVLGRAIPELARRTQDVRREADRIVLDHYAPASVVIDDRLQVIQFHGHTGRFLEPAPGPPSLDLLQMAREGLLVDLRMTIDEARASDVPVLRGGVHVFNESQTQTIQLSVIPFRSPPSGERYFIVLFKPASSALPEVASPAAPAVPGQSSASERELERLKQELATTKAYVQSVVQEHETSFEELQAAHEEIISSNEELQSTNEELQTAKEELQATNEELTTVNDELQNRIAVASQLSNDLANLVDSINIPTMVLGSDLRIRRFSPSAQRMLSLQPSDIGRLLGDFKLKINVPDLESIVIEVMDTLSVKDREVTNLEGRWYKLFVRPYKTLDNRIDGTVISLIDIDPLKTREQQLEEARDYSQAVVETVRGPLVVLDGQQRIHSVNKAFCQWFDLTAAQCAGQSIYAIGNGRLNIEGLRTLLEQILPKNTFFEDFEISHDDASGCRRTYLMNARRLQQAKSNETALILLAMEDISERKEAQLALQASRARIQAIVNAAADAIITIDETDQIESYNHATETLFGYDAHELIGQSILRLIPAFGGKSPERMSEWRNTRDPASLEKNSEIVAARKDGSTFPAEISISQAVWDSHRLVTLLVHDVTSRKELEHAILQIATQEQMRIGHELHDSTGQELTGLTYIARTLDEALAEEPQAVQELSHKIRDGLQRTLAQVRALATGLVPVEVDAEGLMAALNHLATKNSELYGIECAFECEQTVAISDNEQANQLYRIAQESITNGVKHGLAKNIQVILRREGPLLVLQVRDNGVGIPSSVDGNQGMGLRIMRYRASLIGANLAVEPGAGGGTVVTCSLLEGNA